MKADAETKKKLRSIVQKRTWLEKRGFKIQKDRMNLFVICNSLFLDRTLVQPAALFCSSPFHERSSSFLLNCSF